MICKNVLFNIRNNVDLWANVPGRLNATLSHNFTFFNLDSLGEKSDIQMTIKQDNPVKMNETISYKNLLFDSKSDEVEFKTNSVFNLLTDTSTNNFTLTHLNQGLLEALTTLTNPPLYGEALNSLYLLFNKAIGTPEEFIKKLFTSFAYDYLIAHKEKVLATILRQFPPEKAEEIYSKNKEYSLEK